MCINYFSFAAFSSFSDFSCDLTMGHRETGHSSMTINTVWSDLHNNMFLLFAIVLNGLQEMISGHITIFICKEIHI